MPSDLLSRPEILYFLFKRRRKRRKQRTTRSRSSQYWDRDVPEYTDKQFLEDFRVSRRLFDWLCHELRANLERNRSGRGSPLLVPKIIAVALYRWAAGCSLRVAGCLFGVGRATVLLCCKQVALALNNRLYSKIIRFPDLDDTVGWKAIDDGFRKRRGIGPVAGAIDGTHFAIKKPEGDALHNAYINRKGYASIACQAVVDSEGLFRNVYVGWPGSVHDSRLLRNSSLCNRATAGNLMPPDFFIIGDSGYALSDWVMVPFPTRAEAHPYQTAFNFAFSSTRIVVEQAFGRLKMRWRVLLGEQQENPETATRVAVACMILHNLASKSSDSAFRDSWAADTMEVGSPQRNQEVQEH